MSCQSWTQWMGFQTSVSPFVRDSHHIHWTWKFHPKRIEHNWVHFNTLSTLIVVSHHLHCWLQYSSHTLLSRTRFPEREYRKSILLIFFSFWILSWINICPQLRAARFVSHNPETTNHLTSTKWQNETSAPHQVRLFHYAVKNFLKSLKSMTVSHYSDSTFGVLLQRGSFAIAEIHYHHFFLCWLSSTSVFITILLSPSITFSYMPCFVHRYSVFHCFSVCS